MTARAVSEGDEGGEMGSSADRDSKGLEDEGKGGAELDEWVGTEGVSMGAFEFGPRGGYVFSF